MSSSQVNIKSRQSYSQAQISEMSAFSKAFERYLNLVQQNTPQTLSEILRLERHEAWISCALATFFGTASTADICHYWSQKCDEILQKACDEAQREIPGLGPIALFAFGKLGSEELNMSSDIDVVFVSQDQSKEALAFSRRFLQLINDNTSYGFCFRVDYDLRPGGKQGPVVPTVDQFEDYYGNYGEAWERLAFVRFRKIWGSQDIQSKAETFSKKFSYRKHLDYTLLSDLQILRKRIHEHYWHRSHSDQLDLKLGVGGIRDLELFVHALQVVHGGKDPSIRSHSTETALSLLEKAQLLPGSDIRFLKSHYWHLRHLENLVQIKEDQQTHILNMHSGILADLEGLRVDFKNCDAVVSTLLGKVSASPTTLPETLEQQKEWLKEIGFSDQVIEQEWQELISATALSRQKERDEQYRKRFLFLFIEALKKYPQKLDRCLSLLKDFLKATRAKATFFSLFLNHENLIEQVANIFASSPYLSRLLCSRPELIDSFIYRSLSIEEPTDLENLLTFLAEKKLMTELISGTEFISDRDLDKLNQRLTQTADQICKSLLLNLHGSSLELNILCLGKWGGQELGLHSDLDFIFVTAKDPTETDLKLARRFLNRLTETNKGGSLYPVDLRLRPSGKGGVIVTSAQQLKDYLQNTAEAWERQAYLRSRWLIADSISFDIADVLKNKGLSETDLKELERIRKALLKNQSSELDLKYSAGGFVEIEFAIQIELLKNQSATRSAHTLEMLTQIAQNNALWRAAEKPLREHFIFMRQAEQLHQISSSESGSVLKKNSEGFQSVAELFQTTPEQLETQIITAFSENSEILKRLDPRRSV